MLRLILGGAVAALFFSSSFLVVRAVGVSGSHWAWTASLRYLTVVPLLAALILTLHGPKVLGEAARIALRRWKLSLLLGLLTCVGCYGAVSYAGRVLPAWALAGTWQFTTVASLPVLVAFGQHPPLRAWLFSLLVFLGVISVQASQSNGSAANVPGWAFALTLGALVLGAFGYPAGNQLLGYAAGSGGGGVDRVSEPSFRLVPVQLLVAALGSIPIWAALLLAIRPPLPSVKDAGLASLVALTSGVLGTGVFWWARQKAQGQGGFAVAGVDATQALETVFALGFELWLLGAPPPSLLGWAGVLAILGGSALYAFGAREHS